MEDVTAPQAATDCQEAGMTSSNHDAATALGSTLLTADDPVAGGAAPAMHICGDCESEGLTEVGAESESAAPGALRVTPSCDEPTPAQIVEALLFASDAPISAARLAEILGDSGVAEVVELIRELNARYEAAGLSFRIEEIARGYQMLTLPVFQPWLARLTKQRSQTRLSDAALETLAIIAYRQPLIRADIEAIRGVACGDVVNRLREAGLVKIVGRAEVVGRPMLYGTTKRFLEVFGLADLNDLPPMEALTLRRPQGAGLTLSEAPTYAAAGA